MRILVTLFFGMLIAACGSSDPTPGTPSTPSNPTNPVEMRVSAGASHSCVLLTSGDVRCWGQGADGRLGSGNENNIGDNEPVNVNVNLGGTTATQIATGKTHTCALLLSGDVRCWGPGSSGKLGLANAANIGDNEIPTSNVDLGGANVTQITAGNNHTCALLSSGNLPGNVRCWGQGTYGQLGLGNDNDIGNDELPTANVNLGGATVTQITAGGYHTCALLSTGNVRCWGEGGDGQLGLGNVNDIGDDELPTANVNLGGANATQITAGDDHTCALLSSGSLPGNVRCWGNGTNGQLGLGNSNSIGDDEIPTANVNLGGTLVKQITAGYNYTCAILSTDNIRCWGSNFAGQLGLGSIVTIGVNGPPLVDINFSSTIVTHVDAGAGGHTCAVFSTNDVRCWGFNFHGQLGLNLGFHSLEFIGDDELPNSVGAIQL